MKKNKEALPSRMLLGLNVPSSNPIQLSWVDLLATAILPLRKRRVRSVLSSLGISIGISVVIAVVGIPASQSAQVLRDLDSMGANLIVVSPATDVRTGVVVPIPDTAPAMVQRIGPVRSVFTVWRSSGVVVYRTNLVPSDQRGNISAAIGVGDIRTLNFTIRGGRWFDTASSALPTVVLGGTAASQLRVSTGSRIWILGQWWAVIGVLEPVRMAPQLDLVAFLAQGWISKLGETVTISEIFVSTPQDQTADVRSVIPATANPWNPAGVAVSQLSDLRTAEQMISTTFLRVSVGLGSLAVIVGAVGVANSMIIAVMERRMEIGLRRALGARTSQIAVQFVVEAGLLGLLGGLLGTAMGLYALVIYAAANRTPIVIPGCVP